MVTLKDVAERAGVSIATVSYCINGSKSVSPETRSRIMKAIEELDYVPNSAARSLKREVVQEIGVIFPDIDDHYRAEILRGIVDKAERANFTVNIAFTYNSSKMERKIIQEFIGKNVRGIILITCQQNEQEYFRRNLLQRKISTVFLGYYPEGLKVNFYGFDDYQSFYEMTKKLLDKGYRRIALLTGLQSLTSIYNGIQGYEDAFEEKGLSFDPNLVITTDASKEAAFRATMKYLTKEPPQALIAASDRLMRGAMEAFWLYDIQVPRDVCLMTIGEEVWNGSNSYPGTYQVSRAAYALGEKSTELLIKDMHDPNFTEKEFHLMPDNLEISSLDIPEPVQLKAPVDFSLKKEKLRILTAPLTSIQALQELTENFRIRYNVDVTYEICSLTELLDRIVEEKKQPETTYDICQFDVSWLRYLANSDSLMDITEMMHDRPDLRSRFMKKNLANCCYENTCYGIPFIGGTQLLFYRRDLFETPEIQRAYQQKHKLTLRPPKTWKEFNNIAKFFTREYNPDSPTDCGTAIVGKWDEELVLELLARLWGYGGGLIGVGGKLQMNSRQNVKGFQSFLESSRYTYRPAQEASVDDSFRDFGSGKIAMLLSYSEYASRIRDEIKGDIVSKIGYSQVPTRIAANVGWQFGINPRTDKMELIEKFFYWYSDRQNSYYTTIMSGQSAMVAPHKNHELMKLYPWLALSEVGQNNSRSRIYPYRGKSRLIKPREVEHVFVEIYEKMQRHPEDIERLLAEGQRDLERMFSS